MRALPPFPGRASALQILEAEMYGVVPEPKPFLSQTEWEEAHPYGSVSCLTLVSTLAGDVPMLLFLPSPDKGPCPCLAWLNFDGVHTVLPTWGQNLFGQEWPPQENDLPRGSDQDQWPVHLALAQGFAVATAWLGAIRSDCPDPSRGHGPAISAWAAGLTLLRRAASLHPMVDPKRVFACGHSRLGKAALWAAACDQEFAGAVSVQSGRGGASPHRAGSGETIQQITQVFPYWFLPSYASWHGREDEMPWDQHWLHHLIAPRPLLVLNAEEDLWADPRGQEELCQVAAGAFPLGKLAWHTRPGGHRVDPEDWEAILRHFSAGSPA